MYKRILVLSFVFMLAFSPISAIAAEVDETNDRAENEEVESTSDEDSNEEEESEDREGEANNNSVEEADEPEEEPEAEQEETGETEEESDANTEEVEAEEEISTLATDDEDLNLKDIHGTANGDIEFDISSGSYKLELQAGLSNYASNQDIENKWVGFAIPNGVNVVGELPSGVVRIQIAGKNGLAVKVPNIRGIGGENVYHDIHLTGEVDDNSPVLNMYLLNVDTEAKTYEEIGEISSQRGIDFSVMEENPSIDLSGSINGEAKFDSSEDKVYYLLDVTVNAENSMSNDIEDLYVAFDLPEGVQMLNNDDTPDNVESLNVDGSTAIALKLPTLEEGDNAEVTYSIPVIGMSDEVVQSDTINLYTIADRGYNHVGQFSGNISVDFTNMDQAWYFDVKNEVITDYPGVNDNQKGFRFNYTTRNLTLDDVDEVVMEFVVPDDIEIEKPQYIGGSTVDIDWNGNTATVTLGDLSGAEGYYGYFTAVGNTTKSIEELKDTEVTVTLYRDGNEEVLTLTSPFVEGEYDENDFDAPEEPQDPTPEDPTPKDPTPGEGDGDGDNGNGSGEEGSDDNDDETTVEVEDGDDTVVDEETTTTSGGDDELPKTATNTFTMMLIGAVLLLVGGSTVFIRRKTA